MWAFVRVIPCALLVGCSGLAGVSPVVDDQVIVAAVQSCDAPQATDPATFMEVGFSQVKAACEAFFVNATKVQQNALAANTGINAGLLGATSILNATTPASAAARAISITQAGVIFSEALINDYVNVYTFNTHLYKVRQLVQSSMADYMTTARKTSPVNYCIAYTRVSDLASLCSLAAMQADLDQQVAIPSTITPTPPATGASTSLRPLTQSRAPSSTAPTISYTVHAAP
jgi:hypothetical protein